jgi:hypothetical protein
MIKTFTRFGAATMVVMAMMAGCGNDGGSPAGPESTQRASFREVSSCGEDIYLSLLSPVLPVWEDSLETWLGDGLNDTPAWTELSTVDGYLGELVPVLQQWEGFLHDSVATAVIDTVADFDPATTDNQAYLSGLSSVLVSWKSALETARGRAFLPELPVFQPDVNAPVMACVADTTIACADTSGVVLEFEITAVDDCDPAPVVTCDPPSGSTFPMGATLVTCTATDVFGNTSTCTFTVNVEADTEPPVITAAYATPAMIWPPNHKWVDVQIGLELEDDCDAEPVYWIMGVTSNEPVNGKGDGNTAPDWMITGEHTLKLRAERAGGGSSRIYTIAIRAADASGNTADTTVDVVVPHDQGK